MKTKELLYLAGLRPKPQTYGYEMTTFNLEKDGAVQYARWKHPYEREKNITQESVDELRKFLREGDVAIDIGAHTGDSTIPIALAVGPSGCVLALEPNTYVFPLLEKNAALNADKTRIIPLCYAATQEDGEFEFSYSDSGYCNGGSFEGMNRLWHGHAFKLKVQGRNVVQLLRKTFQHLMPRIKFVKIDCEGYDLQVIESMLDFLSEAKPFLKTEVYKRLKISQRKELFRVLVARLYYSVYKVENDHNYMGPLLRESDMSNWRHFDVFCAPRA